MCVKKIAKKADYQNANFNDGDGYQYEMLKNLELSNDDHLILMNYCKIRNIKFFSTAFDVEGVIYLEKLGFDFTKIPSGEITNFQYLKAVALCGKPVIIYNGMSTKQEINKALEVLLRFVVNKEV